MDINDLNNDLTQKLKDFLALRDHIDTGDLYASINFTSTYINDNLNIDLEALEYIDYLDEGFFLDDFFDLESTLDVIADFYIDNLLPEKL